MTEDRKKKIEGFECGIGNWECGIKKGETRKVGS